MPLNNNYKIFFWLIQIVFVISSIIILFKLLVSDRIQLTLKFNKKDITKNDFKKVKKVLEKRIHGLGILNYSLEINKDNQKIQELPKEKVSNFKEILIKPALLKLGVQQRETTGKLKRLYLKSLRTYHSKDLDTESINKKIDNINKNIAKLFNPINLNDNFLKNVSKRKIYKNYWQVILTFNKEGTTIVKKVTQKNTGKNLNLAIIIDGKSISEDIIEAIIVDGKLTINDTFTKEKARALEIQLKSGSLPISLEIIKNISIKPSINMQFKIIILLLIIYSYFIINF